MQFDDGLSAEECRVFVLRRERSELHRRIEGRVEAMLDIGLVEEAERLTAKGKRLGRTASQAVGYREALALLAGEIDRAQMLAQIQARTRRFAKRQGTWFRSLSECRFVDIAGDVDAAAIAARIGIKVATVATFELSSVQNTISVTTAAMSATSGQVPMPASFQPALGACIISMNFIVLSS